MNEAETTAQTQGALAEALARKNIEGPDPETLHSNGWGVIIELGMNNEETIFIEEGGISIRWTGDQMTQIPRTVTISTVNDHHYARASFRLGARIMRDLEGSFSDEQHLSGVNKIEIDEEGQLTILSDKKGDISETSQYLKLLNNGTILKGQLYKRRFKNREETSVTDIPAHQSPHSQE